MHVLLVRAQKTQFHIYAVNMCTYNKCEFMYTWHTNLYQLREEWDYSYIMYWKNILLLRATINVIIHVSFQTVYKDNGLTHFHVMMSHQTQTLRREETWRHLKVALAIHKDHETNTGRKWCLLISSHLRDFTEGKLFLEFYNCRHWEVTVRSTREKGPTFIAP